MKILMNTTQDVVGKMLPLINGGADGISIYSNNTGYGFYLKLKIMKKLLLLLFIPLMSCDMSSTG